MFDPFLIYLKVIISTTYLMSEEMSSKILLLSAKPASRQHEEPTQPAERGSTSIIFQQTDSILKKVVEQLQSFYNLLFQIN